MDPLLSSAGGQRHLLLGNEAIVRGALEAGMAFATCYPGTPSSEVPDTLYRLRKNNPGEAKFYFEYSTNEKVALECAAGAAVSGLRTLCTMKHVGLNVAADPLMTLAYVGINGGMVILTADDPSLFSSQNEQDNRFYARLSGLPMLEPAGPVEARDMVRYAFDLSEELASPVLLRTTTRVNHARQPVEFADLPEPKTQGEFVKAPMKYVTVPAVSRNLHLRLLNIYNKAQEVSEKSPLNKVIGKGKWGVITAGVATNYVLDAVADLDAKNLIKVLKLGFTYPLPEKKLVRFLNSVDKVLIVEELEPIMEQAVRALVQEHGLTVEVVGKEIHKTPEVSVDVRPPDYLSRAFEYNPRLVRQVIAKTFKLRHKDSQELDLTGRPSLPNRPPNLCAGCPHRASYFVVKQAVGDSGAIFPTDIGCYTLGLMPPISMADFLICMGSSVSSAAGISRATGKKVVGFIGDSTFFHSGLTGLVNAVHNNHNFTLVILDNGTTAMTGMQPHPGVDSEALGDPTTRVNLEQVVRGLGVQHVTTIKPFKVRSSIEAVQEALAFQGVSVVISQEPCMLYHRRFQPKKKRAFHVSPDKCQNHRDCITSVACPAFYLEGDRPQINAQQCTGCALCAQICPENAILPAKD
ncbi:MAG: indolepyruvate ferredoxin oxidoreductase subunit alpha [Deltaproteobacteria bacterium]|nr:indolepyruvate ferredoxin oxidoreductase subunit alpha [Deltaproteobacteria bacterium]